MKTENFDDSIRSKLEGSLPLYRDEDLDRVQNYVKRNQTRDNKKGLFLIGFYALAGFLLVGLLIWDLNQYKENRELMQALTAMKSFHPEVKSNSDTFVRDKYSMDEKTHENGRISNSEQHTIYKENNYSRKNNHLANSKAGLDETKLIPEESITGSQGSVVQNSETMEPEIKQNKPIIKEVIQSEIVVDSIGGTSALLTSPSGDPVIVSTTNPATEPVLVPALDNIPHYLAGAGIEVSNGHNAISLIGEMMLGSKWSISTGIKFVQMDDDGTFFDDEDFENKKGHDYTPPCSTCSTDSGPHQDVHYKYTLLQIPLALNYYFNLQNDFAFSIGLGTDLDVYAKQQLDLDNFPAGIPANLVWTSRCPTLVFNNAKLSLGIQKQWKHFVLKANPFVSKQLTVVNYKTESWYYGLQLSGFYSF